MGVLPAATATSALLHPTTDKTTHKWRLDTLIDIISELDDSWQQRWHSQPETAFEFARETGASALRGVVVGLVNFR